MSLKAAEHDGTRQEPRVRAAVLRVLLCIAACAVIGWLGARLWRDRMTTESTRRLREALEQLQSESAADRAAAAGHLRVAAGPLDMEMALGGLTRALADDNAEVRTVAAQSFGSLIENARKPRPDQPAPELVRQWTDQASVALVRAAADRDASVRASVLSALGATAHQPGSNILGGTVSTSSGVGADPSAIHPAWRSKSELETALDDGSAKWSREVARLYYGYSDDPPPAELVAGLKDESVIVRRAAVQALHKFPLGLDPVIPILLSELDDSQLDPENRELATALLRSAWPTAAVVPTLVAALESRRGDVCSAAALLLGRIGPGASAAVPRLQRLLNEPQDDSVRSSTVARTWSDPSCAAAQALGRISSSSDVIGALTEVLGSSLADRRDCAALGLVEMGAPASAATSSVVAAYTRWLGSPESKSGGAYALSLAMERLAPHSTAEADAVKALMVGLDCASESTAALAAKALGKFGKAAAPAVPRLRSLKESAPSAHVREVAAASLEAIEAASADAGTEKKPLSLNGSSRREAVLDEAKRRVPRFELVRALEEADDLAVLGIRGHPVPEPRREGGRAGFDDRMEPLAQRAIRFRHLGDLRAHVWMALIRESSGRPRFLGLSARVTRGDSQSPDHMPQRRRTTKGQIDTRPKGIRFQILRRIR